MISTRSESGVQRYPHMYRIAKKVDIKKAGYFHNLLIINDYLDIIYFYRI